MTRTMTLEIDAAVVDRARAVAERTGRRCEDVLAEWLNRDGPPTDELSDEEVLALCDSQMPPDEQEQMSELLRRQREERLDAGDVPRLERLLDGYWRRLLRKAEAFRVASRVGCGPRWVRREAATAGYDLRSARWLLKIVRETEQ